MIAVALPLLLCIFNVNSEEDGLSFRRITSQEPTKFEVVYEWKILNFTWAPAYPYDYFVREKEYVPANVIVTHMRRYGDKIYLALPRFKEGVPATLAWISAESTDGNKSPLLAPFPDWRHHTYDDFCTLFKSVHSFDIDKDGMMWVLDVGRFETLSLSISSCIPSLVLIDLKKGNPDIESRHFMDIISDNHDSVLNDIAVDSYDGGYAYITDGSRMNPGIIVYCRKINKFWKFKHDESMKGTEGASLRLDSIVHGPKPDGHVYYSSNPSTQLYDIPSYILRGENFANMSNILRDKLVARLGDKPSESAAMAMDAKGFLYYGVNSENGVDRWNSSLTFNDTNQEIILRDSSNNDVFHWVDGLTIFNNILYVVSNKMPVYIEESLSPDKINFRIIKAYM